MLRIMLATWLYGAVHSALASSQAKRMAARTVGTRNRNGLYRIFFIVQSLVTFAILARYIRRQPGRPLYHMRGPAARWMHAGQAVGAVTAVAAARQVGISRILGLTSFAHWLGNGDVPPEPEAQGPALDAAGLEKPAGPFAWMRHPLNFAPIVIFWLWPHMTTNLLAFNIAATVYLILGSAHEEQRNVKAYGRRYRAYQQSGVPFYFGWPAKSSRQTTRALIEGARETADLI